PGHALRRRRSSPGRGAAAATSITCRRTSRSSECEPVSETRRSSGCERSSFATTQRTFCVETRTCLPAETASAGCCRGQSERVDPDGGADHHRAGGKRREAIAECEPEPARAHGENRREEEAAAGQKSVPKRTLTPPVPWPALPPRAKIERKRTPRPRVHAKSEPMVTSSARARSPRRPMTIPPRIVTTKSPARVSKPSTAAASA